jgi:hypothetical protein
MAGRLVAKGGAVTYGVQYALAWANAAAFVVASVLAGSGLTVHPSWLTGDVTATAAILVLVCGGLAHILPPVTRTPATRDARYISAMAGDLPEDVAKKHGLDVISQSDGSLTVVSPDQPPPH